MLEHHLHDYGQGGYAVVMGTVEKCPSEFCREAVKAITWRLLVKKPYNHAETLHRAMLRNQRLAAELATKEAARKPEESEVEHGVTAYYAGGPGEPYYQPVLDCLCGYSTGRSDGWSEAGAIMDLHLSRVKRGA